MSFCGELKVFPVTLIPERPRSDLECGGKIVLPPTILDILTSRTAHFQVPMLFKISNPTNSKFTHCGVLEFIAEEGYLNVPSWVMDFLEFKCGDRAKIETVSLPTVTFARFQPQCVRFLDITNPKAVLENYLRNFSCLTEGDVIPIHYNTQLYYIKVEETKPNSAVAIVDCDMEVDFSTPVGYVPPAPVEPVSKPEPAPKDTTMFQPFSGTGNRLDGKKAKETEPEALPDQPIKKGIPDYDYKIGTIEFFHNFIPEPGTSAEKKS